MSLPSSISTDDEVIFGSGPHALVYAATRVACGHKPPIVIEQRKQLGGMFVPLMNFRMNSARGASLQSVRSPGPTRVPSLSETDDLNWLLNAPFQVNSTSGMVSYPYSQDFWKTVQRGLVTVARCYTDADASFNTSGVVFTDGGKTVLGRAKRVLFAGGLVEPSNLPKGPAIMSGYGFLRKPVKELENRKIALIGAGATGAQIVEWMFGDGVSAPSTPPTCVHWYGGDNMYATKSTWMSKYHARFAAVGRYLPTEGDLGTALLRPYTQRGEVISLGGAAMVNGQNYDLAIMATGFVPATSPVRMSNSLSIGGRNVARFYDSGGSTNLFTIGTAANLMNRYGPYPTRFADAANALYNTLPNTAALAASLS